MAAGANVNKVDHDGVTALMWGAGSETEVCFELSDCVQHLSTYVHLSKNKSHRAIENMKKDYLKRQIRYI